MSHHYVKSVPSHHFQYDACMLTKTSIFTLFFIGMRNILFINRILDLNTLGKFLSLIKFLPRKHFALEEYREEGTVKS